MKIYSNTITHKVLDVETNTTGLPIYTLETMWGERELQIPIVPEVVEETEETEDIESIEETEIIEPVEEVIEYETIIEPYIKDGVVEFDVDLDSISRDKFSIMRSTYWDGSVGLAVRQDKYFEEIEAYNSHGTCTDKDREIQAKLEKVELLEKLDFLAIEMLKSKGVL